MFAAFIHTAQSQAVLYTTYQDYIFETENCVSWYAMAMKWFILEQALRIGFEDEMGKTRL